MFNKYLPTAWVAFAAGWFVLGVTFELALAYVVSGGCVAVAWMLYELARLP